MSMAERALWEGAWKMRHREGVLKMRSCGTVTGVHRAFPHDVLAESFLYVALMTDRWGGANV